MTSDYYSPCLPNKSIPSRTPFVQEYHFRHQKRMNLFLSWPLLLSNPKVVIALILEVWNHAHFDHCYRLASQKQQQKKQASLLQSFLGNASNSSRENASSPTSERARMKNESESSNKDEKLLLAFSSGGIKALEQELSLLQNNIDLTEEILRNANTPKEITSNEVFQQVYSSCQVLFKMHLLPLLFH